MPTAKIDIPGRMNLRTRTLGGKVLWRQIQQANGHRLQQHLLWKDHHRILDDHNTRLWWDNCTEPVARRAFEQLRGGAMTPRNPVEHLATSVAVQLVDAAYERVEKLLEPDGLVAQRLRDFAQASWTAIMPTIVAQGVVAGFSMLLSRTSGSPASSWAILRILFTVITVATFAVGAVKLYWRARELDIGLRKSSPAMSRRARETLLQLAYPSLAAIAVTVVLYLLAASFWNR